MHLVDGIALHGHMHDNVALPAHFHALRQLIPAPARLLPAARGAEVAAQRRRRRARRGVLAQGVNHAGAQRHDLGAVVVGAATGPHIIEAAAEARPPPVIQQLRHGAREARLGGLREDGERRQLNEDEAHAADDAVHGGVELGGPHGGHVGEALEVRRRGEVAEALGVQVHVVRDGGAGAATAAGAGDGDGAGLGDEGVDAGAEERHGGANGGVPGKGNLGVGDKDVDVADAAGAGGLVDEDGLGQVELARDGLLLGLRGRRGDGDGDGDDGEGVAAVRRVGEDVVRLKRKLHALLATMIVQR